MSGLESLLIDRVLGGRYRIEEVIGRGGMGAVYRAVDERLGRQVAVKVITVATAGDAESRERLRARFFREARSAAALPHHPNVVPVYDFGSDEELGLDYLVMELLRGSDLASRLAKSGAPTLSASLKILLEAAHGLAVGHQQGLVHRDVKPGNIFLARTPGDEVQVRVVDFGIAKLADDDDTLAQLTQDGRVPHSPAYASPEQLRGLSNLSPAADVFSLGAVGFQLLTGDRPFSESDRNRLSLGMPVDPPSVRALNPAVPATVEAVILRSLSFDPEHRYADAGKMAGELAVAMRNIADSPIDPYLGSAAIITGSDEDDFDRTMLANDEDESDRTVLAPVDDDRTLLAPPPGVGEPRPGPIGASRPPPQKRRPPPPKSRARREERRGIGGFVAWGLVLVVLIAAAFWGLDAMQQQGGRTVDVEGIDTTEVAEPEPPEDEVPSDYVRATELNNNAADLVDAGRPGEALALLEEALELVPDNWHFRRNYGVALFRTGQLREAQLEMQRAIQIDPNGVIAYANLAEIELALGDTTGAMDTYTDYMRRESNELQRLRVQGILAEIEAARQSDVPLLGEPVPGPRPSDAPAAADTLTRPPPPRQR